MKKVIDAAEILRMAEAKLGSLSAVSKQTRLFRSTLKRIKNGSTNAPHPETITKLVRVLK